MMGFHHRDTEDTEAKERNRKFRKEEWHGQTCLSMLIVIVHADCIYRRCCGD